MERCNKCNKILFFLKKFYNYKGFKKGSFELTTEKIYCEKCYDKLYFQKERKVEKAIGFIEKMAKKEYDGALKEIEKIFNKKMKEDWYNKGNILRNLNKDKEAVSCYDEAIYIDTHYVKAWYRKGQTFFENNKFKDAGKCFDNVIELEKSTLNKDSLIVKYDFQGAIYESSNWIFGALLMRSLSYMEQKKFNDADLVFSEFYNLIKQLPPFNLINPNVFIEYCVKNSNQILDWIEPNMFVEICTPGVKH